VQANLESLTVAPTIEHKRESKRPNLGTRLFSALGPGLITGAADDDPAGIATYSVAGAQLGTTLLWTALITWPLMAPVQMMCARIAMCSGKGLAGAFRTKFPKPLVAGAVMALLVANTINVGADLSAMADAAEMLTGLNSHYFVVCFGVFIAYATIRFRYYQIANAFKWLALSLLAYVVTGILIRPHWGVIVHDSFIPAWPHGHEAWATLVAILGTTISPYLFFWQAAQEVEEERAIGRRLVVRQKRATSAAIKLRALDVGVGTFYSNLVMYFIILTTALTLNVHGITDIDTTGQVAQSLEPLAGKFAAALFTLGILGVGLLAIPTLTGSAAYAVAETFQWRHGLDHKFASARAFYGIIILSTVIGVILDFADVSPVKALFWTAVINGLIAPFLLVGILLVACDAKIMNNQCGSLLSRGIVGLTALVMFGAAVGMFVF
jgi:NRAMP (natural resistance-associated macrophage protein)-like metal ion transporter